MNRSLEARLRKLEAAGRDEAQTRRMQTHLITAEGEEAEREITELKASGQYQEGDFILRLPWLNKAALEKHGRG